MANQMNDNWINGNFAQTGPKSFVIRTGSTEVTLVSGMDVEMTIGQSLLKGRVGNRDDGVYFLGRMPMFAIPFTALAGLQGRVSNVQQIKKSA